ncbi:MAG: DUF881 domain-containing protein [Desulfotomaculum sp.]|nr:DUF881 domain-containing protein [Desulfotomaculum sp.]
MKIKGYHLVIVFIAAIIGVMMAVQFKASTPPADLTMERTDKERTEKLVAQIEHKKKQIEERQIEVEQMRRELKEVAIQPGMKVLQERLITIGILAGTTAVNGPGIEVILKDSEEILKPDQNPNLYVLHDEDVLKVLNELKAAGAEALAINDQRLVATSEIRCIGPTILVNRNKRLATPFVITAIGHPETLYNSLFMKGGVAERLKFWGIQISAQKVEEIIIPSYGKSIQLEARRGGSGSG